MKNYNTEPNVDGQVSDWNEAGLKMIRIHRIQTELNVAMMNPLQRNESEDYNYIVVFNLISRLYHEGKPKYATKEILEVDGFKNVIDELLIKFPVHATKINNGYNGSTKVDIFNSGNWKLIKTLLEIFESKVKLYNDVHGLSTKNTENMNGGSIIR